MSLLSPQLEAFMAVSAIKTVHGAAQTLGLTQTGVTQRIRTLEHSLGATLFTRSRRGMLLTSEGEALLRYCLASRDLEGEALAKIQGAGIRKSIRIQITGTTSIMRARIVPSVVPVMKRFPELLLSFDIRDAGAWIDLLRTGGAQIAVVSRELITPELDSKVLKPDRYVLVGCRAWKKRPLLDIVKTERIIDFDSNDPMSFHYLRKFKLIEHARTERHFINSNESVAELIAAGLGYGVFTEEFAERFLKRCDIALLNDGRVYEHPMALAWYARPSSPPYWKALIDAIH